MSGPKESGDLLAMQAESWHAGECSPVEKLREQHAVENRDVLLDLIYSEVLLREEKGQSPDVEEYVVRFPALAEEIKRQFVVHSGFAEVDSTLKPDSTFDDVESGHDPTPMSRISIPGFELLEVIGRGGTAVAYRAHDETLNRTVAVKLLAGIDASGPGRRQQLMKEAEAAASLSHPSIVRIYQIGETADGVPFLVMDYLSGGSVATLMKDGPLDGDRAVSIILEVAKAIGYAHSCGVIHRDLKPGNILLDEQGKPYVCDFGLARKLDPNETRQSTNIVGTPAYMPPEQARGESVDERADVYSLGATLYEMLVGRSPFHASTTWDTLFQVMTADPVSIRKLNSSIPLDLETICAKCIAKAVDHRYQTAGALADDLQCFLDNRPIAARRVSQFEVFRRWCLRNRALAGSLLVGVVLATALLIGSVVAAVRFQRQNERLVRTLETSIEAADQLLISVTEDSQLLPKSPGSQNVSRRLLQRARRYYSAFLEENQNDPRLRFQLARTHAGLVLVAARMDELETVETEAAAALKLLDDLEQSEGRNQKTLLLRANVLHSHAAAMQSAGRFKDALQLSRQANALCEVAETAEPKRSEVLSLSAKVLVGLANSNQSLGDNQKSVDLLEQANERYSTLVESEPDSSAHRLAAARVQHNLGNSKQAEGFEVMSRHYHSSIDLLQQLPDDERQAVAVRAQLATSSMNLGMAYSGLNDNDSAAQNYGFAIKEFQRLVELEPVVNRHKYLYAVAVLNSGNIDNQLQNFERLASRCQEVIPVVEKLIEAEPENFGHVELKAMLSDNVAHALRRLGNVDQAIVALKESEGLFQDLAEAADWAPESMYSLALNQYMLAQSYSELGNIQDALNVLAKARSTTKRGLSKDKAQADLRVHELDLAVLETEILEQQEPVPTEKIIMLADAGLSLANTLGKDLDDYLIDRNTAVLLLTKANCQFTQKQFEESASQARLAIEKLEATFQTPYESDVRELFGEAYLHLGRVARILLQSDSGNADLQARFDAAMAAAEGFGVSEKAIESLRIDE